MPVKLHLEQENRRHSGYLLPVGCWELPDGAFIPSKGDTIALMSYSWGHDSKPLEPRYFEIIERTVWMVEDREDFSLARTDVHLTLRDLGPVMRNEEGLGALGRDDPAYPFPR